MKLHGIEWPHTGRRIPEGAKTEIHNMHKPWLDLLWWDEKRKLWVYVSTVSST